MENIFILVAKRRFFHYLLVAVRTNLVFLRSCFGNDWCDFYIHVNVPFLCQFYDSSQTQKKPISNKGYLKKTHEINYVFVLRKKGN